MLHPSLYIFLPQVKGTPPLAGFVQHQAVVGVSCGTTPSFLVFSLHDVLHTNKF